MAKKAKKKVKKRSVKKRSAVSCQLSAKKKTVKKPQKPTTPRKPAKPKIVNYSAEKHPEAARIAASEGCFSHRSLADKLRVPKSSIGRWMKDHEPFRDAVADGKKENVEQVEESLHRLANGGIKRTKVKQELVGTGKGQKRTVKMKITERVTETTLPHAGACRDILRAHNPEYKEKSVGEDIADGLSKLLKEIDGSSGRLPEGG